MALRGDRGRPGRLRDAVRSMPAEGFVGANVTVPHKGAALAVADEISEVAREIGAANTLVFDDGEIRAYNTDAEGFLERAAGVARRAPGARARRRRRRPGGRLGAGPRRSRGRGLEPHRAALAEPLRRARRPAGRRPMPAPTS